MKSAAIAILVLLLSGAAIADSRSRQEGFLARCRIRQCLSCQLRKRQRFLQAFVPGDV